MDKRFWAIIGIIVLLFGGALVINNRNSNKGTVSATEHLNGNLASKVSLVEYGDFECSACAAFHPITHEVQQKYAATVRFQFRNLPLISIHPNAFAAARAAEAADLQGKFWQMHDLLYENQDTSGQAGWVASKDVLNQYFVDYAKQLGLNEAKFKIDFASTTVNSRINADTDAFKLTGKPMSTPSFFLNGTLVDNATLVDSSGQPSVAAFSKLLDQALAKQ
jgi:protein-disulfide isomerase